MLTLERIKEIQEREKAASPGPWHAPGLGEVHTDHDGNVWARVIKVDPASTVDGSTKEESPIVADGCTDEDAEFIAMARQDIPDLLADNAELRAEVVRLKSELEYAYTHPSEFIHELICSKGYGKRSECSVCRQVEHPHKRIMDDNATLCTQLAAAVEIIKKLRYEQSWGYVKNGVDTTYECRGCGERRGNCK